MVFGGPTETVLQGEWMDLTARVALHRQADLAAAAVDHGLRAGPRLL